MGSGDSGDKAKQPRGFRKACGCRSHAQKGLKARVGDSTSTGGKRSLQKKNSKVSRKNQLRSEKPLKTGGKRG